MPLTLYPHNQEAYCKVVEMMDRDNRAAIVHPTGTGKSFIAFKLAEDNPEKRIIWLAPSEYIFRSQRENYIEAGGLESALKGILFLTYSRLMYAFEGENDEGTKHNAVLNNIMTMKPDYIILDEFHRCGAEGWGRGVDLLLQQYPNIKVLGLSATHIRYLDSRRDMAQELFYGHIASKMELSEAVKAGILPAPVYICGLYEYKHELGKLAKRISNQRNVRVKDSSLELLDKLRYSLQNADGPKEIFSKHMKKDGKYIIFCIGREHMDEMIDRAKEWFMGLDMQPTIYRAVYDSDESPEAVKTFQRDESEHLKLLYCIDMLNEGIHIANVDGVILLRPTASPTLYLQQIGRALAVSGARNGHQPIIFDLVDNFDSLKCIDSFLEGYRRLPDKDDSKQKTKHKHEYDFKLIDEVRESRILFDKLMCSLASTWEACFQEAEKYYASYGDLKVPKRYITENGIALGSWILTQKRVRAGNVPGNLTKEQIMRLDELGMEWDSRTGKAWETGYQELLDYFEEFGHLDIASRFVTQSGYPLGRFVSNQRIAKKNCHGRRLLPERERRLNAIGFIWEKNEHDWDVYYRAAKDFYEKEGNLIVPSKYVTDSGLRLGAWICGKAGEKDILSEEKIKALEDIGMVWGSRYDAKWNDKFYLAKCFYEEHGHLDIPSDYKIDGVRLGKWIHALRNARLHPEKSNYRLDEERIRLLDSIGMRWSGSIERCSANSWEIRYRLAEQYYEKHGNLKVSQAYTVEAEGMRIWLGKWLVEQRKKHNSSAGKRPLTKEQEKKLEKIGMKW